MAARLLIKMGDGCYLSGQEGQEGWNTHNSFDNIGFVSDVLPVAQVTLIKAPLAALQYSLSLVFTLGGDNELIAVSRTPCVWTWVGQVELTPRLVLGTFTFSSKALPWPC